MATRRILVAVSTPWAGEKVFTTVRDLAGSLEASVVVVHVAKPTEEDDSPRDTLQRGEQTIASLAARLSEAGVEAESLMLYGDDVARSVVNAAGEKGATLLVIGLSGKGAVARLLSGDVPIQIIRHAHLPVLVIPPDWAGTL